MTEKKSLFVTPDGQRVLFTFILVSSLFLLWGFCNGMIDVMDKHFQDELGLTKAQSAWVQFAHYLGYFLMAIPAGWLASKLGYKGGIIAGLLMVAAGGLWFIPATSISEMVQAGSVSPTLAFVAFLVGVCLIATGLTFLETIANPYTTVLGDPRYAATRINLAQSCNGIGWILGPIVGSVYFYSTDAAGRSTGSQTLYIPYAAIAVVVIVLALVFVLRAGARHQGRGRLPPPTTARRGRFALDLVAPAFRVRGGGAVLLRGRAGGHLQLLHQLHDRRGAGDSGGVERRDGGPLGARGGCCGDWLSGWFEAGPGGALAISDKGASNLASLGFVCFLIGRFTGAGLLRRFSAHKVLGLYGVLNVVATFVVFLKLGWVSVASVFLSYFFMSIMFPTIFALGISGLGARAKRASSYIVMAIMGGAILPKLMGAVADRWDMSRGFIVPMVCFVFVALYGFYWPRLRAASAGRRRVSRVGPGIVGRPTLARAVAVREPTVASLGAARRLRGRAPVRHPVQSRLSGPAKCL